MIWNRGFASATCLVLGPILLSGCAVLYKVQLSDIESRSGGQPISIVVSENTVDFQQLGSLTEGIGRASKSRGMEKSGAAISNFFSWVQWGPRTGVPVFNDEYAGMLSEQLMSKCKGGHLANIVSVREARVYPVISGQIVRVDATCYKRSH